MLVELVGIRSGIALSSTEAIGLLQLLDPEEVWNSGHRLLREPTAWWLGDEDEIVRVRVEELELNLVQLLSGLGTVPDKYSGIKLLVDAINRDEGLRREVFKGGDPIEHATALSSLSWELFEGRTPAGLEHIAVDYRQRTIGSADLPTEQRWSDQVRLADLFATESIPVGTESGTLFDQRFIDYLNAQPNALTGIHWRQFEYLCAEYFKRSGYKVRVTPPRGDGGVDIYAVRTDEAVGPQLVVIQAKRYGREHTVKIEEVKAFWSDVEISNATKGVIATTSHFEKGARDFVEGRLYRYQAADAGVVRLWLSAMGSKDQ